MKTHEPLIAPGAPCYVVAEIGFNHGGDPELARSMIAAAAHAGADAVKFQSYRATDLCFEESEHYGLIKQGEMDLAFHQKMAEAARADGVAFFSTPFSAAMVDLLERVDVPAYKVASMDVTNLPLLKHIARTGKPILLSTGMATLTEIAEAVAAIKALSGAQLVLLHCVSNYPAEPQTINLRTLGQIKAAFGLDVGFSDHTLGNAAAIAAVALGARVIEKHFTTDRTLPGPDHKMSADPARLADLVAGIREAEAALGRACADETRPDRANARLFRRGLHAARDIAPGTVMTADMIKTIRPAGALAPADAEKIVGRAARKPLRRADPLTWDAVG